MKHLAHILLLQFQRPGREFELWPIAVLLFDPSIDKLHVRCRQDYKDVADAEDVPVLWATVKQLEADAERQSGSEILHLLEATLSNSVRLTERIPLRTPDIARTLAALSREFLL